MSAAHAVANLGAGSAADAGGADLAGGGGAALRLRVGCVVAVAIQVVGARERDLPAPIQNRRPGTSSSTDSQRRELTATTVAVAGVAK